MIEKPISKHTLFLDGAARFSDLVYIVAKDRNVHDEEIMHSRFIAFDRNEFTHADDRNWNCLACCVVTYPSEKFVAVGEDGEVYTYVGGVGTDEALSPEPKVIRNLGVIDGLAYACGLGREVYRREGEDTWIEMSATPTKETLGFEAIDGFSKSEIYTVGLKGEIWQWDSQQWAQRSSPTNLILTGVCCAKDENVYICGQLGTLIVGRNDSWQQIELDDNKTDFWDVHYFSGKVYIASMQNLYQYSADTGLELVDFGNDAPSTCYRLTSAKGVLWSIGADDVFSFDGSVWARVD